MIERAAVAAAVEELATLLRADGGDLLLVEADPRTDRVRLQLVLDEVSCAECVLPPDALYETVLQTLGRHLRGEFELVLTDPRRSSSHG